jgi:enoyl-CoA hydratase/carnithine racemase
MQSTQMFASLSMHGHVGVISMQNSAQHNALKPLQVNAMLEAIRQSQMEKARALVIISSGKNFCAGADIDEFLKGKLLNPDEPVDKNAPLKLFKILIEENRPIIAAVDGASLGGGLELLLCADLVVSTPRATFGLPEVGLGILPRTAIVRLSEIIGRRRAMELILTRCRIDASQALSWGLINKVCEPEHLLQEGIQFADNIISAPPTIIGAVKRNLGKINLTDWDAIHELLREMDPNEWKEGLSALKEKRPSDFNQFWNVQN